MRRGLKLVSGGEGGSDPWRETPRREEEGGDCGSVFDWRRCIRAAETEERRCGGLTGARTGGFQQQQRQRSLDDDNDDGQRRGSELPRTTRLVTRLMTCR
ncbi:hypothetical protein Scep_018003 [Stephania cephalantha]|uniref:Uncharacterized protein n=1 Tax=Stephania cephalantha TaxID=152367 RepID=A0AAP0IRI9_9MAGN